MDIKAFIQNLKDKGIPIILFRDYKTKEPSISFSLLIISSILIIISIFSNYFAFLKGINCDQALNFFIVAASLYFGRNINFNGKSVSTTKTE